VPRVPAAARAQYNRVPPAVPVTCYCKRCLSMQAIHNFQAGRMQRLDCWRLQQPCMMMGKQQRCWYSAVTAVTLHCHSYTAMSLQAAARHCHDIDGVTATTLMASLHHCRRKSSSTNVAHLQTSCVAAGCGANSCSVAGPECSRTMPAFPSRK
jgi:hypothetical protein